MSLTNIFVYEQNYEQRRVTRNSHYLQVYEQMTCPSHYVITL
jgi:hypothetical protein